MILKKDNVERIATGDAAQELIKKGFIPMDGMKVHDRNMDISKMKVDELRKLAEEKGIENIESLNKQELLKVIKEVGEDD